MLHQCDFRTSPDEVHIWQVPLDRTPLEIGRLAKLLSSDETERAARFVFPRDRDRFITGRAGLRLLLGRYLSKDPSQLRFRYGWAGKPELADPDRYLAFNVSHSAGLALIAIGGSGRLGVDIEQIRPRHNPASLRGFFAPAEQAAMEAIPPELRERAFFACWTRKEAYIKARGDGLSFGLDRFEVSVAPDRPAKLLRVADDPAEADRWELHSLDPAPGFAAALAVEGLGCRLLSFEGRMDD